jgi:glycosyltransferase involved in cell wall biosynthesis
MNILHAISSIDPRTGGPAEALRGLVLSQVNAGLSVRIVATWKKSDQLSFRDWFLGQGIPLELVGPCWAPLRWHPRLFSVLRKEISWCDIIHIHGLWEEIHHKAARIAWNTSKPYLFRPCGMLDPWSLAQSRIKKALYLEWRLRTDLNRAAGLHFTSLPEHRLTHSLHLCPPAIVEPNGLSLEEFANLPPRGLFRANRGVDSDRLLLLFMGRLHPKKGLELLIPALARLKAFPVDLVIAGPDPDGYADRLKSTIGRLQLGDRVRFVGMLQGIEKQSALVDADLFVLPSYQENFGNAVIEALASGTPVLISDQVNIHEEIRTAEVGGIVPLSIEALATELTRWLTDFNLRRTAAARAQSFVRERYDWNQIARRWVNHYQQLFSTHEQPTSGAKLSETL